ncbi:MAG: alkaline phosphatase family protein [Actinomycetes bacterium]
MTASPGPLPTVRYDEASLSDVLPSVLASLGVAGERGPLQLADVARTVVLLVDGMGWEGLQRHRDVAPFLTSLPGRPLTAGFPSTTVTSLTSLGTGLPPGAHGFTGYSSWVEEVGEAVNWLAWRPVGGGEDLRQRLPPEQAQPQPTVFERAADAGISVTMATAAQFEDSGLTRAALRGGRFAGSYTWGDSLAHAVDGVQRGNRSLVYCYLSELDLIGHVRGAETDAWLAQLHMVDSFAEALAERLPPDARLVVTADHGMVTVPEEGRVDFDASGVLQDGVVGLAGEPRVRHVHARRGAAADVLAAWRAELGDRMWVGSRDDAVAAGLFGPDVTTVARERIGDVLAIASTADVAVVRRSTESVLSGLPGQHGALTDDELLVPLLTT